MKKFLYLFLCLFLVIGSCKKDDDNSPDTPGSASGDLITTSFTGTVRDLQGNPLSGVLVKAGGSTAVTNSSGMYVMNSASVGKKRAVLIAEKSGFWMQQHGMMVSENTMNRADIVLFPDSKSYSVNAVSGGTVTLPGGTVITFPANAFVTVSGTAYSGQVVITGHEIKTDDAGFGKKIPGNDLYAVRSNGDEGILISYGMAGAKLYDTAGNELKIAAGKTATVRFPIVAAQVGTAPASIPLWHYDETKMYWVEEGSAVRNGNYYEGSVSHFSWWNCDDFNEMAYLTLYVTRCNGTAAAQELVSLSYQNNTVYSYTNSLGQVWGMIPANAVMTATFYNTTGTVDTTFSIGPFATGSNTTINVDLGGNCDQLIVMLQDCNNIPIAGNVSIFSNGQLVTSGFTNNGNYNFTVPSNGTYQITGISGTLTGGDSIVVTSSTVFPQTITLNLCDTIATVGNITLNITSSIAGNQTVGLDCTGARYLIINGIKQIHFNYVDSVTGDSSLFVIYTPGYAPGTYAWNTFDSKVMGTLIWQNQYIDILSGTGSTTFTNTPPVGSDIEGSFTGNMTMQVSGTNIPAQVNATFDVVRIQ